MKFLFGFNTVIFLATLVAVGVEPIIGLMFMLAMGLLNVIQTLFMLGFLKYLHRTSKRHLVIYGSLVPLWLIVFVAYCSNTNFPFSEKDLVLPIGGSLMLGAYFVILNGLEVLKKNKD